MSPDVTSGPEQVDSIQPTRSPSRVGRYAAACFVFGAILAGGYGVASAQTTTAPPTTTAPADSGTTAPAPDNGRDCPHDGTGPGGSTGSAATSADTGAV
jgi:hypothetical protein